MNVLVYILIGILISEFICYFIALITNEDKKIFIAGSFVVYLIFNSLFYIINNIRKIFIRSTYVPVTVYFCLEDKQVTLSSKQMIDNATCLTTYRAKNKWLKNYHMLNNPMILTKDDDTLIYYLQVSEGKYVENAESIRKIKKEKVYTQEWVNTYLLIQK